ncbi:hypothetical protein WOLCODRAFT_138991 [Wolfiporia cocos MD-104 SS10]|uniref:Uncharacterized protein n=1 Tax=Wolfiporia cocos (strain MD-104) TaxID=742152 RepID=A0A2H3JQH0_WOLCO|nr:hypothetical protein WOLCODRAFT_138991 [Wolfiporia cocos MD-104 SS10]
MRHARCAAPSRAWRGHAPRWDNPHRRQLAAAPRDAATGAVLLPHARSQAKRTQVTGGPGCRARAGALCVGSAPDAPTPSRAHDVGSRHRRPSTPPTAPAARGLGPRSAPSSRRAACGPRADADRGLGPCVSEGQGCCACATSRPGRADRRWRAVGRRARVLARHLA